MKQCQQCGKDIPLPKGVSENSKKYNSKKFCSKECHNKSMEKIYEYICSECGGKIITHQKKKSDLKFCNDICKGKYLGKIPKQRSPRNNKKIIKVCAFCNKEYYVINSRKNSKFCSQSCREKFNLATQNKAGDMIFCDNCGEAHYRYNYDIQDNIQQHYFCSRKCMSEFYSNNNIFSGENSPTWNGGKKGYKGKNWSKQRQLARKRDNYICQECGISEKEYGQELSVHHIIPFVIFDDYKKANKLNNLICLCEPCHRKIHSGNNHPSQFSTTYEDIVI